MNSEGSKRIPIPEALQQRILATIKALAERPELVPYCSAVLEALDYIELSPTASGEIVGLVAALIKQGLESLSENDPRTLFAFGVGLRRYSKYEQSGSAKAEIWPRVFCNAERFKSLPAYLEALLNVLTSNPDLISPAESASVTEVLIENLHSPSHLLRKLSLGIIAILGAQLQSEQVEIINTALAIEDSPIDLQSARILSMHVRTLATRTDTIASIDWLTRAVVHYCFGLMTFKLSQLWTDAVDVLKEICRDKTGQDIVMGLSLKFLEGVAVPKGVRGVTENETMVKQTLSKFDCSNMVAIESRMHENLAHLRDASQVTVNGFRATHIQEVQTPPDAPSLGLRVLLGIPHVAEKHSRQLVPVFLRLVSENETESQYISLRDEESAHDSEEGLSRQILSRRERKMMFDLFGCFVNPKVLYRSKEVYQSLQTLLTHGDVNVQKSALKALMTWKISSIVPYEENLTNLLDDARFRDELAVFVNVDDQDSVIRDEHRRDLMPILSRILFGRIIARTGPASKAGQAMKRKATLTALSRFCSEDLREFVNIALGPLANGAVANVAFSDESLLGQELLSVRKQVGVLNMMKDMFDSLGSQLVPYAKDLVDALLYCTVRAARILSSVSDEAKIGAFENHQTSLLKDIRQTGLQCLIMVFKCVPPRVMQPYLPTIVTEMVSPRLKKLPVETAQSISGLLQLFATWASDQEMVFFLNNFDGMVLRSVTDCLNVPSAKPAVKLFVLDNIIKDVAKLVVGPVDLDDQASVLNEEILRRVLAPHMEHILGNVGRLIRESPSKELLESSVQLVSILARAVQDSTETKNILEISVFLLEQPSYRVKPRSKGDLLQIIQHFVPISDLRNFEGLQDRLFCTVSSLFGYFKDRPNRHTLTKVLHALADRDIELGDVAELCTSLNSFSAGKLDEPDFEQRLAAFTAINETRSNSFSPKQWRPLLYNMLFFVKDNEELAIRSNAALALRRFVEINAFQSAGGQDMAFAILDSVLLPALHRGVSERSELVRSEYLSIMAHVIRHNPSWEKTNDMRILLVSDDEEASFFDNILHIQHHRRLRALRRLAAEARKGILRPTNAAHFFIPLVEHFIFDKAEDESAHNLSAEAITTISALALSLEWPHFRALLNRYTTYIQSKPELDKTIIKLVGRTIDALSEAASIREAIFVSTEKNNAAGVDRSDLVSPPLTSTMPRQEKLASDITRNLLPSLQQYLHEKDDSTVSLRIPVAVSIVKLLKLTPLDTLKELLPSILTDVCNILRSRAQESRDLTRKTLVDMSILVGHSCFGFILKELRSSLARGYQLHVLSFTVHAMLVAAAEVFSPGQLDYCVPQIATIIMDGIFGATGEEKDAEGYINKMREVKSSKSFDSMELVAKVTSIDSLVYLLRPLQSLLQEKLDTKLVKKADELLRRIGAGVLRNQAINNRRTLIFCHEIIREVYKSGDAPPSKVYEDHRTKRFLIKKEGKSGNDTRRSTSSYGYKLVRFSFDVLRSVLHKYDSLQTPANISGFIPILGDAVVQPNEEVQTSALRLLLTIIKVPVTELDENASIYTAESVKIIRAATSLSSQLAQAALKLISAMLRDRRHIEIRESDLAYLLKRLIPDLDEPDRQGVIFGFLKTLLTRKIVITELYEVMDIVASIMITNHTKSARDLARGVYFQFIMDYPQGKGRFEKQLAFLIRNLDYKHEEGRQSVMEAIHLLLSKTGQDLVQEFIDIMFVPLVMVIVNDESVECREMASALVKAVFEKADLGRNRSFLAMLRSWIDRLEPPLLSRAALQVYGLYLESAGCEIEKEGPRLLASLGHILKTSCRDDNVADWELLYVTLQTFSKVCQVGPALAYAASSAPLWTLVRQCLKFRHAWVKLSASKLLGNYFAHFARSNAHQVGKQLPLKGSDGLLLGSDEMLEMITASLRLLRVPGIGEELAAQSVRNVVFLSKAVGAMSMSADHTSLTELEGDDVDSDDVEGDPSKEHSQTVTQFILERASAVVRRGPAIMTVTALSPMKACLQIIGALGNHLSGDVLMPSSQTILLPLHNLTDPSIPVPRSTNEAFTTAYKELVSNSAEIMSLLQKKFGTPEYISSLNRVRSLVKERREGRRVKRRIEAVAEPEKEGKTKQRKGDRKRAKRKEKSNEERGRRRGW